MRRGIFEVGVGSLRAISRRPRVQPVMRAMPLMRQMMSTSAKHNDESQFVEGMLNLTQRLAGAAIGIWAVNGLMHVPASTTNPRVQVGRAYHLEELESTLRNTRTLKSLRSNPFVIRFFAEYLSKQPGFFSHSYTYSALEDVDIVKIHQYFDEHPEVIACVQQNTHIIDSDKAIEVAVKLAREGDVPLDSVFYQLQLVRKQGSYRDYLDIIIESDVKDLPALWHSDFNSAAHLACYMACAEQYDLSITQINQLTINAYVDDGCSSKQLNVAIHCLMSQIGLKWAEVVEIVNQAMARPEPTVYLMCQVNDHIVAGMLGVLIGSIKTNVDWDPGLDKSKHAHQLIRYLHTHTSMTAQECVDAIYHGDDKWSYRIELMKQGVPLAKIIDLTNQQIWATKEAHKLIEQGVFTKEELFGEYPLIDAKLADQVSMNEADGDNIETAFKDALQTVPGITFS